MWLRSQLRRHYFGQIKLVRNNITADFCGCLREKNTHLERLDDHDYRQMRYTVEGNLFIKLYFNWPCYITKEVQYGFLVRWNRELTLKCKLKCYVKLMKDPLGVSSSKGNQGTTLTSLHIGHRRRDTYVLYVLECLAMEQLDWRELPDRHPDAHTVTDKVLDAGFRVFVNFNNVLWKIKRLQK